MLIAPQLKELGRWLGRWWKMQVCILLLFVTVVAFTSRIGAEPQGWHGLIPLHSTRADVEKLLGPSPEPESLFAKYDFGDRAIFVEYSSGPCRKEMKGGWNFPPGTVISITIDFKERSTQFPSSRIDKRKFKKVRNQHLPSVHHYINDEDGIMYEIQEGMVQNVEYFAAAKDLHLQCPNPNVK